jgi:hypothetical protein
MALRVAVDHAFDELRVRHAADALMGCHVLLGDPFLWGLLHYNGAATIHQANDRQQA